MEAQSHRLPCASFKVPQPPAFSKTINTSNCTDVGFVIALHFTENDILSLKVHVVYKPEQCHCTAFSTIQNKAMGLSEDYISDQVSNLAALATISM